MDILVITWCCKSSLWAVLPPGLAVECCNVLPQPVLRFLPWFPHWHPPVMWNWRFLIKPFFPKLVLPLVLDFVAIKTLKQASFVVTQLISLLVCIKLNVIWEVRDLPLYVLFFLLHYVVKLLSKYLYLHSRICVAFNCLVREAFFCNTLM